MAAETPVNPVNPVTAVPADPVPFYSRDIFVPIVGIITVVIMVLVSLFR